MASYLLLILCCTQELKVNSMSPRCHGPVAEKQPQIITTLPLYLTMGMMFSFVKMLFCFFLPNMVSAIKAKQFHFDHMCPNIVLDIIWFSQIKCLHLLVILQFFFFFSLFFKTKGDFSWQPC